jgi:hypothetical protein
MSLDRRVSMPNRDSHQAAGRLPAVLHLVGPRHAEAATLVRCQIAKASSSNVMASRRVAGSSIASS